MAMGKIGIIFVLVMSFNALAYANNIMEDFDSLGGNDVLINRAKLLQPDKEIKIVQDRIVDLHQRSEFSFGYGNIIGGDAYLQTQMLLFNYHFRVSPHWSIGLSYFNAYNSLTREGRFLIHSESLVPDLDQPDSGYELVGNFAPIYGKINMFDLGILQFDMYLIGSYGLINLKSGETDIISVGGGLGLWISQHLTSRLEIRQRFYTAQRFDGPIAMRTTLASLTFGYLF